MIAPTYYRSLLSPDEQEVYKVIVAGLLQRRESIHIRQAQAQSETVLRIVRAVHYDHPELFFVNFWSYRLTQSLLSCGASLQFQIMLDSSASKVVMDSLNAMAASVQESVREESSREGVYVKIAKKIATTTKYLNTDSTVRDHTVAGPAVYRTGVCEAIAKMFLFLCQRIGVPCAMATGRLDGVPHAWNMVELNGSIKYVDVTAALRTVSLYALLPAAFFKSEQSLRRNGYEW